jgi:hypothetical protein
MPESVPVRSGRRRRSGGDDVDGRSRARARSGVRVGEQPLQRLLVDRLEVIGHMACARYVNPGAPPRGTCARFSAVPAHVHARLPGVDSVRSYTPQLYQDVPCCTDSSKKSSRSASTSYLRGARSCLCRGKLTLGACRKKSLRARARARFRAGDARADRALGLGLGVCSFLRQAPSLRPARPRFRGVAPVLSPGRAPVPSPPARGRRARPCRHAPQARTL